jgi:hypothetical protein
VTSRSVAGGCEEQSLRVGGTGCGGT